MDITTTYMGLSLKNPIIVGASPLTASFDSIKKLEESCTAASFALGPRPGSPEAKTKANPIKPMTKGACEIRTIG